MDRPDHLGEPVNDGSNDTAPGARSGPGGMPPGIGITLVLLAATGFGLLPLLTHVAYAAGISPDVAAFYRFGIPAVFCAPFLPRLMRNPKQATIAIGSGLFMGVGVLGYFHALNDMPIAVAVLIFFTFPLFAVIIGLIGFRLKPDARSLTGASLVLIACALFVDPANLSAHPLAVLHAFMAPVAYATLILVISHVLAGIDRLALMAGLFLGTALGSGVGVVFGDPASLLPADMRGLMAAVGLVTIGGVLPQLALTYGAPAVGPARTSILAAFELVVALGSGWLLIGEPFRPVEALSGGLILGAVVLAGLARPARRNTILAP